MELLLWGALLLSQTGTSAKQYAMKKCGMVAPGALNSTRINLIRAVICIAVSLGIWLVSDRSGSTLLGVGISIAAGVGTALNLFTWILSSQRISMTLIEGICTIGTVILPLFLAPYLYGGESVSLTQWIGTALVIVALLLFGGKDTRKKEKASIWGSVVIIFVCALGATVASVAKKYYTFHVTANGLGSVEFFTLISFVTVLCTFVVLYLIYSQVERRASAQAGCDASAPFPYRRVLPFVLIAAVALYVTELFAAYASKLPSAIYYPATKAMIIIGCFLLDSIVFKERITLKKVIGLTVLLVAVVLINF